MTGDAEMAASESGRGAWWPAIGVHVGLLLVAFSAAWTVQPEGWFSTRQWLSFALIGFAVLGASFRPRSTGSAALLALGGATALYLAYDPQLAALPGMGGLAAGPVGALEPSLAHLGVLIAALFASIYWAVNAAGITRPRPFTWATVAATVSVLVFGAAMWLALRGLYDLSGTSGVAMLGFRVISYALLILACLAVSGARGVNGASHIYLGLALLVAVARNVVA